MTTLQKQKIVIALIGSRGDIQPGLALGQALTQRGHEVTIATTKGFNALITPYGLNVVEIADVSLDDIIYSPEGKALISKTRGKPLVYAMQLIKLLKPNMFTAFAKLTDLCEGQDALVHNNLVVFADDIAQKLAIPAYSLASQPPNVKVATDKNKLGFKFKTFTRTKVMNVVINKLANEFRKNLLQLKKTALFKDKLKNKTTLLAVSDLVCKDDFGQQYIKTGFMYGQNLSQEVVPIALVEFLSPDFSTVCITFGAMVPGNVDQASALLSAAVKQLPYQFVFISSWIKLDDDVDNAFVIPSVSHEWLLPKVDAFVHHGGAGTTAAALRAGVANFVCPFIADQPYWGRCVYALGIGPEAVPFNQLTEQVLVDKVKELITTVSFKDKATEMAQLIEAQNGAVVASMHIEEDLLRRD